MLLVFLTSFLFCSDAPSSILVSWFGEFGPRERDLLDIMVEHMDREGDNSELVEQIHQLAKKDVEAYKKNNPSCSGIDDKLIRAHILLSGDGYYVSGSSDMQDQRQKERRYFVNSCLKSYLGILKKIYGLEEVLPLFKKYAKIVNPEKEFSDFLKERYNIDQK